MLYFLSYFIIYGSASILIQHLGKYSLYKKCSAH